MAEDDELRRQLDELDRQRGGARGHYRLIGQTPVPCSTYEWVTAFENEDRRVFFTRIGPFEVSTVFLGLDHNFSGIGPPILFETMTFLVGHTPDERDAGSINAEDRRTSTWIEAEARHKLAVEYLRANFCEPGETPIDLTGEPPE